MKAYLTTFLKYKYLLHNLISRDLKVKYRRSTLGLLWSVLNPLLMSIVISIVFQNFFKFDVPNFAIYYLTGSLIFNFMNEATSSAMVSIVGNAPLIKKVYIPKYIFPLEKVMFAFVNMLFSMIALVIMMGVTKLGIIGSAADLNISWTIVLFFIPMLYTPGIQPGIRSDFSGGQRLFPGCGTSVLRLDHGLDVPDTDHLSYQYRRGNLGNEYYPSEPYVLFCDLFPRRGDRRDRARPENEFALHGDFPVVPGAGPFGV